MPRGKAKGKGSRKQGSEVVASAAQKTRAKDGLSKSEVVRQVIAKLGGKSARPKEIQEVVKNEFGIEMSVNHISNIKSTMKKKKRGRRAGAAKAATAVAADSASVAKAATRARNGRSAGGIAIADVEQVKELTERIGAAELNALVDLFAK